jgi:hypothetical protein
LRQLSLPNTRFERTDGATRRGSRCAPEYVYVNEGGQAIIGNVMKKSIETDTDNLRVPADYGTGTWRGQGPGGVCSGRYRSLPIPSGIMGSAHGTMMAETTILRRTSTISPSSSPRSISDRFISSAGPGARVSLITALKNPALVRTLTVHEPALLRAPCRQHGGEGGTRRSVKVHLCGHRRH